ncbi:MAG: hypothetical protein ACD_28C00141G0003 [uncultured bacterium]|nr:MAG: hypothetical protein ACD_28C00141G0003 [uncultured bacterium]
MHYLEAIASNPGCTPELLAEMVNRRIIEKTTAEDDLAMSQASQGIYTPNDPTANLKARLLRDLKTPLEALKQMAEIKNWVQLFLFIDQLGAEESRPEFFHMVYESCRGRTEGVQSIFLSLAKHPFTPQDVLLELCRYYGDPSQITSMNFIEKIRHQNKILEPILKNPNLPSESRELLEAQLERVKKLNE